MYGRVVNGERPTFGLYFRFQRTSFSFIVFLIVAITPLTQVESLTQEYVCNNIDIRNSVAHFRKLENCTVVEGYLQILLLDNSDEKDYENLSFPKLREVTGYLLLYRAFGLRSLDRLFPNLAVIRGYILFHNYALVIFEMFQLKEIGLKSLTNIVRGSVRIEKNPSLCYVDTVNWDNIAKAGAGNHFIKSNHNPRDCPNTCTGTGTGGYHLAVENPVGNTNNDRAAYCWNAQHPQKICGSECENKNLTCMQTNASHCCHHECLGGCTGTEATDCIECRHVLFQGRCMRECPINTYKYKNRRCVTESECRKMPKDSLYNSNEDELIYWKPLDGECRPDCPQGYNEHKTNKHYCVKCKGRCPKVCPGGILTNVASAQRLRGCTHINGSLEIQIQGGSNITAELEENLRDVQEISGFLKIARSFPLVSLNFLKNLEMIRGENLEIKDYSFLVLENENLKELWDWTNKPKTLTILNGKIFFHFNSKLCLSKINDLKKYANVTMDWDDRDVSPSSNGDRVACDLSEMNITILGMTSTSAVFQWMNFRHSMLDRRSLLGYVIYYREAPTMNVSMYDGHDACGSNIWKTADVEAPHNNKSIGYLLTGLKPFTQYALYLRTYTTTSGQKGAHSKIIYFVTEPDTPMLPVSPEAHSNGHNQIIIKWKPPKKPHGNVTHYIVEGNRVAESQMFINQRDYCLEPITYLDLKKSPFDDLEDRGKERAANDTDYRQEGKGSEKCCPCSKTRLSLSEEHEDVEFQIHFEDFLQNTLYKKNPQSVMREKSRSRRSLRPNNGKPNKNHLLATPPVPDDERRNGSVGNNSYPPSNIPDKFRKVVYHNTYLIVNGLHHFTEYTIEIIACQEEGKKVRTRSLCSSKALTTARTLKLGGADDIDANTIRVKTENATSGSIYIKWEEPKDPNGLIVSYSIEYKRMNVENYKPEAICITQLQYRQLNGSILNELHPGNYSLRLRATSLADNGNWTLPIYFQIPETKGNPTIMAILIALPIILGVVLLSAVVIVVFKKRNEANLLNATIYASVNPEYMSAVYEPDEWEVPREKIALLKELGQGSFGMVYEGEARDLEEGKPVIKCAVKTVNENATTRERIEFLQEASVMKAFNCHHVVKLLGVVAKCHPPLVVMELMANGDLKSYLRSHRPNVEDNNGFQPPTLKQILQMAIEIGDGMAYLAAKKFVHRDLAARNCMVAEDLTVKIGDFGMTRDIYETDYYRKGGKGLLPVRWMAPESLKDGVFTSQSDVWSYGVVLWEMATLASQPYQGLSNEQVLKYVINDGIMEKPENCPDRLYALMKLCWAKNPKARPTFTELIEILLPDVNERFKKVSFYFTQYQQMCLQETDVDQVDTATPATPLKSQGAWDESSLASHDNSDEEMDIRYFPSVKIVQDKEKKTLPLDTLDKESVEESNCRTDQSSEDNSKGLSIHSNEGSKGISDDSKSSKVSNLSNGSLANGNIPYPAGRTSVC
ncbi:insulin-like peptide receptor isoform X2 [Centruroides sculpturatus]|uniref:insulin-like peptide receptor isoform X2 n=1 Tax=Centruroides sculpturatus TaxID=218467 RepID=UPI000C6D0B4A|nr:insulin-like peptide receptor isoform X2 [Centruroides sculpturatus]